MYASNEVICARSKIKASAVVECAIGNKLDYQKQDHFLYCTICVRAKTQRTTAVRLVTLILVVFLTVIAWYVMHSVIHISSILHLLQNNVFLKCLVWIAYVSPKLFFQLSLQLHAVLRMGFQCLENQFRVVVKKSAFMLRLTLPSSSCSRNEED